MLPSFCNDSITIVRAAEIDSRGSFVRDWATATETTIQGCSVQPEATSGNLESREQSSMTLLCYMPEGTDIRSTDRIEFNGITHQVIGEPMDWRSPSGAVSHRVVRMEVWHG